MKGLFCAVVACVSVVAWDNAVAETKVERCEAYARNAAAQTPTTTGVARGAARGAIGGAIVGEAGRGAAAGAVIGGTRRAVQKGHSYTHYYNKCMHS